MEAPVDDTSMQIDESNEGGGAGQVMEEQPPMPPDGECCGLKSKCESGDGSEEDEDESKRQPITEKTIQLTAQDGRTKIVSLSIAEMSVLIKTMIDDDDANQEIPLPNVDYEILESVIDFCELYDSNPFDEIEKPIKSANMEEIVSKEHADFLGTVVIDGDKEKLFKLILAANYLDIKPLLDLCCAKVASMIKGKNPDEIRSEFNIVNDFTEEEEKQIREENKWCEET